MPDSPTCLQLDIADTIGVSPRPLRIGCTLVMRDRGIMMAVMNNEFVPRQIGAVI